MLIQEINAREARDSRNEPTISVSIITKKGSFETTAPSGKSTGRNEAKPFSSKGINYSIEFIKNLSKSLSRINISAFDDLEKIESLIRKNDFSKDWSIIGGNAVFALEASILKALAAENNQELYQFLLGKNRVVIPKPLGNCIGGGKHLSIKQKYKPDVQEFLIMPETQHFFDSYFVSLQAYKKAKTILFERDKEWNGSITDENAYCPTIPNESVLDVLIQLKNEIKTQFDMNLRLGVDFAATSFYQNQNYFYNNFSEKSRTRKMNNVEQIYYLADLIERYKLFYVEDALEENAFSDFAMLMGELKKKNENTLVCGDDLICTQLNRLEKAIKMKAINAVIIKPNQNGSLLQTKKVVDLALKNNIVPVISHRSGETKDSTIAHLGVGWKIPYIKTGIFGIERQAKLQELMRIEKNNK